MNAKNLISIFCSFSLMLALSGCDWCGCCSKTKAPEPTKSEGVKSSEPVQDHTEPTASVPKPEESMPPKPVEPKRSIPVIPHPEEPIRRMPHPEEPKIPMPAPKVAKAIEPKIAPMPKAPKVAPEPKFAPKKVV